MKVAVIGAGIAGISAAYALQTRAEVTLFEADGRIGGHTDTHVLGHGERTCRVDSGFIVFNEDNYPQFSAWLAELGVGSRPSDMSFGVSNRLTGLEYGTADLNALFSQRRNAVSPGFLRMLRDLRRFYREAPAVTEDDRRTLGEYLAERRYSPGFGDNHLVPMCAALWSLPARDAALVPVAHVVAFMSHHRMLQLGGRPPWRVVEGGSASYLSAFTRRFRGRLRVADPVRSVARAPGGVKISARSGGYVFDALVLACHSDQALALLDDACQDERRILGAIEYQRNVAVVHSDPSVMPVRRSAWSSWNAVVDDQAAGCQVTYWMNRLQALPGAQQFFVTLNPTREPQTAWCEREYAHPVFTREARHAQRRLGEISGVRRTWYCGAYWGWGFHEDGFASGVEAARHILEEHARAA